MATLVIHAPYLRGKPGSPTSFETLLKTGIGKGFAIYEKYIRKLPEGSKVILLRKDRKKKRAEGILVRPVPTDRYTPQGIRRYDVHIKGLTEVHYKSEKLNRFGVAVIGDC